MKYQNIHFVINPAAGHPEPVLHFINKVMHPHDIKWHISITQADGDGARFASEAVQHGADLVVSYGGDGTVKDVVNGLLDNDVPLAILHGGTGNAMAYELGIPNPLEVALNLIAGEHQLKSVDLGKVTCANDPEKVGYFMLRTSMGVQTQILETADRELKDRWGNMAYVMASLQVLRQESEGITYRFTIDGQEVEGTGLTAMIANSASVGGQRAFKFAPAVDPSDGLLDVLIIDNSVEGALSMLGSALEIQGVKFPQHWTGKSITIHQPANNPVTLDGEAFAETPVEISLVESAVKVIVPLIESEEGKT